MHINSNYIVVEKLEEPVQEGFKTIEVQDNFIYKGKIVCVPEQPSHVGNHQLSVGDTILYAKYSPDTHEIELEGKKVKFINISDVLVVMKNNDGRTE